MEVILLPRIRLQLSASTLFTVGRRRRDEDGSNGPNKNGVRRRRERRGELESEEVCGCRPCIPRTGID